MTETIRRSTKRGSGNEGNGKRRTEEPKVTAPVTEPARSTASRNRRPSDPMPNGLDREEQIRQTAYFLAEQDGFRAAPEHYWHEAERIHRTAH
jgi:hypothetical protein